MESVDVTVIGGGPCGLFAAFYAGMRGMSVRIVDSLPELGGQLVALYPEKYVYDMPGFPKVLAKDLAAAMIAQGTEFKPHVVLGERADRLEKTDDGYMVSTTSGMLLPTKTVVISAGAGAFSFAKVGVDREAEFEGKGLYYGVKDTAVLAGKRLVVVGGGDSAFDWCLHLEPIAADVTLVHRRDQFRAHEDTVRQVMASRVKKRLFCTVHELHGTDRLIGVTLQNVQTKELERIEADAVVVNVGFKSSLGPISGWGLNLNKHQILVDDRYETNLPGVFAVGDVAAFEGKIKLIATGVGEAATAVCFAKTYLDPAAKLFPGHSSDMDLGLSTPA